MHIANTSTSLLPKAVRIETGDRWFTAPNCGPFLQRSSLTEMGVRESDIREHDTRKTLKAVGIELEKALALDPDLKEFSFEWLTAPFKRELDPWPTSDVEIIATVQKGASEGWMVAVYAVHEHGPKELRTIEPLLWGKTFQRDYLWRVTGKVAELLGIAR